MKIRFIFLLGLVPFFLPLTSNAQDNDLGIWYAVDINHKINDEFSFDLTPTIRTGENASTIKKWFLEPRISYKHGSHLSYAALYRINQNLDSDGNYHWMHSYMLDIKGSVTISNVGAQLRARFQHERKPYERELNEFKPANETRIRLKVDCDIPSTSLNTYVASAFIIPINDGDNVAIKKIRYICGLDYKISDNHAFSLEYSYQANQITGASENIFSLKYAVKL